MSRRPTLRTPAWLRRAGAWLALAALAVQLAAGSVVMMPAVAAAALDPMAAASICGAGPGSDRRPQYPHPPSCAVCPLCQAVAQGATLLPPPVFALAAPRAAAVRATLPPPARAPPARFVPGTWPRGPPRPI